MLTGITDENDGHFYLQFFFFFLSGIALFLMDPFEYSVDY